MRSFIFFLLLFSSSISSFAQASFFDATFGIGGKAIFGMLGRFNAVAIQPDGKIVAVGVTQYGATVARFKENGTPDTSFAVNGFYYQSSPSAGSQFYDVLVQPDGNIVAAGQYATAFANMDFVAVRLTVAGVPDPAFGIGGIAAVDFTGFNDYGTSIALQADGKIILAGRAQSTKVGVARLLSNGVVDSSFSMDGRVYDLPGNISGVGVLPDGRIVVGGTAPASHDYALMTVCYLANGAIDASFNGTGIVYATAGDPESNSGNALAVQPDGKILITGSGGFGAEGSNFVAVRYNTNGTLDGSFGSGGIADIDFYGADDVGYDIYIEPGGSMLFSGSSVIGDVVKIAIVHINNDGTSDNSFGVSGKILNAIRGYADNGLAVVRQNDGKIIVAGNSYRGVYPDNIPDPFVCRFLPTPSDVQNIEEYFPDMKLYPNPATEILNVTGKNIVNVEVWDMIGKRVNIIYDMSRQIIDVSDLASGVYFVRILVKDGISIVQHVTIKN